MNRLCQLAIGVLSAGAGQFGILVVAGVTDPLLLAGGVVGQMGMTAGAMLKNLPKKEWSEDERARKLQQKGPRKSG